MDTFRRSDMERIIGVDRGPCVSVFLPTQLTGPDAEQDAIRLKNLLNNAEDKLTGGWMRATEARKMLRPAVAMPDEIEYWGKRDRGLAIFIGPGFFEAYRVPIAFRESVQVSHRFRIQPIVPLLRTYMDFFLLALSQNDVTLYRADERSLDSWNVTGLPQSRKQALNYDQAERGSQVHTGSRAAKGKQAAVFHGHGGQPETYKDDLLAFCRQVDRAVSRKLHDAREPLVLASVDHVASIYRRANSYRHLLKEIVPGNPHRETKGRLHERALRVVTPLLKDEAARAASRYEQQLGTSKAIEGIRAIVPIACQGRVEELWYDPLASVLGIYDPDDGLVDVTGSAADDDLIDLALHMTLKHRGSVYSMSDHDLPTNTPVAALLRF